MPTAKAARAVTSSLTFEQIKEIIPQRFPFLMLDRVTELVPGKRVVAKKNVTGNEWFYQGHFPQQAITPGAMLLDAMAQAAIILLAVSAEPALPRTVTFLLGSAKVRFLRPIGPGSQLIIEVVPVKLTSTAGVVAAKVLVDNTVAATGELVLGAKQDLDALL